MKIMRNKCLKIRKLEHSDLIGIYFFEELIKPFDGDLFKGTNTT